jgi:hypothetical protein
MAILLPILVVLFVTGATLFLIKMAPCCTAVLFIGIEYLQLLFLLGITHVPWTGTLQQLYRFLGIFALDLNAAVPLQCYLDLNPQGEHVLILFLPIIGLALPLLWIQAHLHKNWFSKDEGRAKRRTCANNFAFLIFLGYAKLLLTSLEAMSCSTLQAGVFSEETIDWFCISSGGTSEKYAAMIGAAGLVFYGMVYPMWVVHHLNSAHAANRKETAREIASVPDKSLFWTGRKRFLLPFQPSAWWWTAFLLGRKFILVCGVIFFQDVQSLTLTFFLVLIIISQIIQRCNPPYIDHEETNLENSKTRAIFRFKTVDMVLHACLIYATAFGLIFLLVSETADARVGLAILLLLVLIPSFVYLLLAACHCLSHGCQSMTDSDDFDPKNPKSSTKKTIRNAKHQTSYAESIKTVSFEHPDKSSSTTAHNLSRAPRPGSSDDGVENPRGRAHREPGRWASQVSEASMEEWQETEDYDDWVATGGSIMVPSFEKQRTDEEDYNRQQNGHARIPIRKNHSSIISAGDESEYGTWSIDDIGDAEEGATEHVFADDDTVQSDWDGESQTGAEVWIDEDTGLPVDRNSGEWTDAETGQSLNSSLMTSSEEEEEYDASLARSKSTIVVAPCDRMEPSTWGRRHSSVYRPSE